MPNILDSKFKYTSAAQTDIRQTFKRVRKELREQKERAKNAELERNAKVRKFKP